MNINEIQDLIKFVAKAGVNEVEIEKKDFKLVIKSDYMAKKKTNFKEKSKMDEGWINGGFFVISTKNKEKSVTSLQLVTDFSLCSK